MNKELMDFITSAMRQAGRFLMEQRIVGDSKFIPGSADINSDLHTEYDKSANHYLMDLLLPGFFSILGISEMLVISEEDNPYFVYNNMRKEYSDNIDLYPGWVLVIDPICGSIPYARGIADYIVSVGVMENMSCVASGIYQPDLGEMFYAEKGQGAYLNGERISAMSDIDELERSFISVEHGVYRKAPIEDLQKIANTVMRLRTAGTCALEMCYVACGRLDGLIKLNQSFYDYLPGSLVMLESNPDNTLVGLDGKTPIFPLKSLNRKASFIATNGLITSELASFTSSWFV